MSEQEDRVCLVAWCRGCNRVVFATVDIEERRKENAREIAKMIRAGMRTGELMSSEVRKADWCCECKARTEKPISVHTSEKSEKPKGSTKD